MSEELPCPFCGQSISERTLRAEIARLTRDHDCALERLRSLLRGASHALRSYQFGNSAPDLAESTADIIDAAISASEGGKG